MILCLYQFYKKIVLQSTELSTYVLSNVQNIDIPSGNLNNYNACVVGTRLFFRSNSVMGEDCIMTCLLDNFQFVKGTLKTIQLISSFPNNKHVEDPRVILHNSSYIMSYTDGYKMAVAKLDLDCNTIYCHYLKKPKNIQFEGGDGREKNWLPISVGNQVYFWYGDNPRTFLIYDDNNQMTFDSVLKTNQSVKSKFGQIRGGCSPIPYKNDLMIWFFHTLHNKKYCIGAYLTKGLDIVSITEKPLLIGNHIVFPCGAYKENDDFYISMGLNDEKIGILKVSNIKFIQIT